MLPSLSAFDWCVVGIYLSLVALIGFYFAGGLQTTRDYFLGGRSLPWWAATLSIIATETSAATYIGTPRDAYEGDWSFLQLVLGLVLGRLFLAFFFVPVFYRHEVITVYAYLDRRFGGAARTTAASIFLVGRVIGSAVRLYAGCLAFQVATGWPLVWAIIALAAFGTLYTVAGGIKAVVWTDVLLGLTFLGGGVVAAVYLAGQIPGGMEGLWSRPEFAAKTIVFRPTIDALHPLGSANSLLAGLAGGFFLSLATHGTDQDIAQRILTCRSSRGGSLSLVGSAVLILPLFALFLLVGTLLYFYYSAKPGFTPPADLNHLFPTFIAAELPSGFRGLVMAGLLAVTISSFTSVLNALASTTVNDFYHPLLKRLGKAPGEPHLVHASRGATVLWGATLVALAIACQGSSDNVLQMALQVLTYFYGALLGAFLLGIFTDRGSSVSVVAGMALSVPAVLVFQLREYIASPHKAPAFVQEYLLSRLPEHLRELVLGLPPIAWPYWIILGTLITFLFGALGPARAGARG